MLSLAHSVTPNIANSSEALKSLLNRVLMGFEWVFKRHLNMELTR
jgi:hypothetical protein